MPYLPNVKWKSLRKVTLLACYLFSSLCALLTVKACGEVDNINKLADFANNDARGMDIRSHDIGRDGEGSGDGLMEVCIIFV